MRRSGSWETSGSFPNFSLCQSARRIACNQRLSIPDRGRAEVSGRGLEWELELAQAWVWVLRLAWAWDLSEEAGVGNLTLPRRRNQMKQLRPPAPASQAPAKFASSNALLSKCGHASFSSSLTANQESLQGLRISCIFSQELQPNLSSETRVLRAVDHNHAVVTELVQDAIVRNNPLDHF